MPILLHHSHGPGECAAAFAAWKGFQSPLRGQPTISSCLEGGHQLWWTVPTADPDEAKRLLPPFVAARTLAIPVREVTIP